MFAPIKELTGGREPREKNLSDKVPNLKRNSVAKLEKIFQEALQYQRAGKLEAAVEVY